MRMNRGAEEEQNWISRLLMRCTVSSCSCVGFKPGSVQIRSCDGCGHGWVAHALEKLNSQAQQPSSCGPVEVALPGLVFDLSSLVLYGAQAIPVRMKILLDRLYSILTPEQVGHILHTLGWCLGDYIRGYMLQFPNGNVLDHWLMVTPEEEALILRQFLRFGETRPIVELMTLQCLPAVNHPPSSELSPAPKSRRSNISTFIEKNSRTAAMLRSTRGDSHSVSSLCHFKENDGDDPPRHSGNLPGGRSLSLPCYFASSSFHCLVPSAEELGPARRAAQHGLKPKLVERHEHPGGTREQDHAVIFQPALNIKTDSDKPKLLIRPQDAQFCKNQESELLVDLTKQNETSSVSPSPSQTSQIFQTSSSYPLSPLPPFSSSFLCPLPVPSFSSCHRPLPLSCSLPSLSPAGGRKGRVTCSICGKSFYDKGTLKIHYNAVHLKIKHRCTVVGCTMVFSSLRSRNRHSANPNPRLHTATVRDTHAQRSAHSSVQQSSERQMHHENTLCKNTRDTRTQMCHVDSECSLAQTHTLKNRFTGQVEVQDGCSDSTHHQADCPPQLPRSLPQDTNQNVAPRGSAHRLDLLTRVPPPLACSNTLASPELRPGCDCGPTTGKQGGAGSGPLTNQQQIWESGQVASKKKPRKSSMPVKIERERTEEEEEECYIQG